MLKHFDDLESRVRVAVLGSTGSIGRQALDVVRSHPDRFQVVALVAGSDAEGLAAQAKEFDVRLLGLTEGSLSAPEPSVVVEGPKAAAEVAERAGADVVLNAVVGAAGLEATMATILSGKILALANKESLVAAGELVMSRAEPGQIRPVDSEHSALWQVLEGIPPHAVRRCILTGSGGPFRGRDAAGLAGVTVAEALAHPVWDMGRKITIDSATMMNKGLEVVEAHFLFGFTYDEIEVVINPQGLVHGMVEAFDGSVLAYVAQPDMRLPIQLALAWPERLMPPSGTQGTQGGRGGRIDWAAAGALAFEAPDPGTFRCLALAYEAGRRGDTYPAVLNASNEVAVRAFLDERLDFLGIPAVVERVLEEHQPVEPRLDGVLEQDAWARTRAAEVIANLRNNG
ncbi:MAG TPA: 1-deoxy-D-xylulose-5-phosphate reductoisomerase [Actinomycetota bacterium]